MDSVIACCPQHLTDKPLYRWVLDKSAQAEFCCKCGQAATEFHLIEYDQPKGVEPAKQA